MSRLLQERAVHVVGIGMHPYQFPSDTPYVQLGLTAVRESLRDAGLNCPQVQAAYVGTAAIGMAAGRVMLRHLGSTGLEVTQVENASASGWRRAMIAWWGPILTETYGSTEAGLVTLCSSEEWQQRPGTVGRPLEGTSIRILGEQGQCLPAGEVGEIYVDPGDNALPFTYRHDEALRRSIERDGHITNGDMGYLDADGYLFITDRKRDMVISGGVNIYPAEIEHCLLGCPEVADVAVFGIPDAEYGEALAAAVVPTPGSQPAAESLRAWVRERLAGYKVPKLIDFHASLPREGMGKLFKNELRAPYWERAGRQI